METPLEHLARELTIMSACGGPLSRRDWVELMAEELSRLRPTPHGDLQRLAACLDLSPQRVELFLRGLGIRCACRGEAEARSRRPWAAGSVG